MTQTHNRRPRLVPRNGGQTDYKDGVNTGKLLPLPTKLKPDATFDQLTARIVMERHRAGTLPEAVYAYYKAAGLKFP